MIIQSADDTKLGEVASAAEDRLKIQDDLNSAGLKLKKMNFNRDKSKVLHSGR